MGSRPDGRLTSPEGQVPRPSCRWCAHAPQVHAADGYRPVPLDAGSGVIVAAPPQVVLEVTVQRDIGGIEIRGTATGASRGSFTLYAARRCSSGRRTVSARGRFKPGSFVGQLAFSVLPVRRGRVCYRIRHRGRTVVTVARRYRVPAPR